MSRARKRMASAARMRSPASRTVVSSSASASMAGPPSAHRPDRAHLDGVVRPAGDLLRPADGGIEIGGLDQVVAAELLAGFGVGAVVQRLRAVLRANGPSGVAGAP